MDKKITNNIILGVFVTVGFSVFVFLIFNIGSGSGVFARQFTLYGKFTHVKGLHLGSEVSLAGLRVGTVKGITVSNDKEKGLMVELAVSKSIHEKIRTDSFAKIVTQGVLGDKYIELTIGSPENPMLNDGELIATQEVVDLFTKSGGLVDDISKQFNKGGEVDTLLKNLNQVAENLAVITTDLQRSKGLYRELVSGTSGEKVNRSLTHVESIMKKIDQGEGTLGALLNDPSVYEDLKNLLGGAKRSAILRYFMKGFIDSGEKASKQPAKRD